MQNIKRTAKIIKSMQLALRLLKDSIDLPLCKTMLRKDLRWSKKEASITK